MSSYPRSNMAQELGIIRYKNFLFFLSSFLLFFFFTSLKTSPFCLYAIVVCYCISRRKRTPTQVLGISWHCSRGFGRNTGRRPRLGITPLSLRLETASIWQFPRIWPSPDSNESAVMSCYTVVLAARFISMMNIVIIIIITITIAISLGRGGGYRRGSCAWRRWRGGQRHGGWLGTRCVAIGRRSRRRRRGGPGNWATPRPRARPRAWQGAWRTAVRRRSTGRRRVTTKLMYIERITMMQRVRGQNKYSARPWPWAALNWTCIYAALAQGAWSSATVIRTHGHPDGRR
ncbi:hypothetical protein T492DRAFT_240944 [Pavlovales sp. CCMP2436]|nr:hypothetical protein T492DRAFT_240944 [Pavlovales sp. CCMP2436]